MKRYIYAFNSAASARDAVAALMKAGCPQDHLSIVANDKIEMEQVPEALLDVSQDFVPAIGRGAAVGGVTGLIAGLVAMAVPPLGIAVAGATLIGFFTGGALLGAWSGSLVGASVPDEVHRKFDDEIKAGHVLLVIDTEDQNILTLMEKLDPAIERHLIWQSELA